MKSRSEIEQKDQFPSSAERLPSICTSYRFDMTKLEISTHSCITFASSKSDNMPGRRAEPSKDDSVCRRCRELEPIVNVRTEPLCKDCFTRYVSTKVIKRMEAFKVRHSEAGRNRKLLLPLSFGPCSTTLLHVLSQYLKGQAGRTGRTGFQLHILHVLGTSNVDDKAAQDRLEKVKARYPEHSYSTINIEDIFAQDGAVPSSLDTNNTSDLATILANLPSATSRSDTLNITLRKSITRFATSVECEAVLFGSSTTTLAAETLSSTAKGRGFSLPWIINDGESPFGVSCYYPMRELLSKEVVSYVSFLDPPMDELVVFDTSKAAVSAKNSTIDELMRGYFEGVERDFPSIVANVVRTTGKLKPMPLSEVEQQCELCDLPLEGQAPERSRLCYGCIRNLPRTAA